MPTNAKPPSPEFQTVWGQLFSNFVANIDPNGIVEGPLSHIANGLTVFNSCRLLKVSGGRQTGKTLAAVELVKAIDDAYFLGSCQRASFDLKEDKWLGSLEVSTILERKPRLLVVDVDAFGNTMQTMQVSKAVERLSHVFANNKDQLHPEFCVIAIS